MTENAIGKQVVDAAYKLHAMIGSGLVETVYKDLLACELTRRNLKVVRQLPVPLFYEGFISRMAFNLCWSMTKYLWKSRPMSKWLASTKSNS